MVIKSIIKEMLKLGVIKDTDDIKLIINIDNEDVSTNGIYDLKNSIYKDLRVGVNGFPRVLKGNLEVEVHYRDSKLNYDVQAADILAGTLRRMLIHSSTLIDGISEITKIVNMFEIVPRQKNKKEAEYSASS